MNAQNIPHPGGVGWAARRGLPNAGAPSVGAGAVLATVIPIRFQVEPLIVVESQRGDLSLFPDSSRFARNSPLRRRGYALRIMRRLI